ncbi:MAG: polysaccharide pyruvyl transferase family protein [Candidatus Aphodosoma sp.]
MTLIAIIKRNVVKVKILRLTIGFCSRFLHTIQFLTTQKNKRLLLNSWMNLNGNKLHKNNWGDDINYWFLRELTDKKIYNYSNLINWMLPKTESNIMAIGSIIGFLCQSNSIIWGSGVMNAQDVISLKPKKVLAVRGPLTRKVLLSNGIDCPKVYGDPALLLSSYYQPKVMKKYKVGIIPHYVDLQNTLVLSFINGNNDILLIDIKNYGDWHEIPDKINQCELILSSSLHGLIISDAYNIPNVWVSFSEGLISGGKFKFLDYFASVNRETLNPIKIEELADFQRAISAKDKWNKISFNSQHLIDCCPFVINKIIS